LSPPLIRTLLAATFCLAAVTALVAPPAVVGPAQAEGIESEGVSPTPGTVEGWGDMVIHAELLVNVTPIAAGHAHSLALKQDGPRVFLPLLWRYTAAGLGEKLRAEGGAGAAASIIERPTGEKPGVRPKA
jgi:hypothetical protein